MTPTTTDKTPDACRLLARLPNDRSGRAALKTLRAHWNRAGWKLRVKFSGKRSTRFGTRLEDANTFRLYADRLYSPSEIQRTRAAQDEQRELRDLIASLTRDKHHLNAALRGATTNADALRKSLANTGDAVRHAAALFVAVSDQRDHWQRVASSRQQQLNDIPGWILYAVAFCMHARAAWRQWRAEFSWYGY